MNILLVGRHGQVAWELRRALACLGEVTVLDRGSSPLPMDLSDPDSIRATTAVIKPDLIVNAAAYTAVDKAEQEEDLAFKINAVAPGILAEQAKTMNAVLIHYSTDYVFPGDAQKPYVETDATRPRSVYGKSKLAGEEAIAQVGTPHYILRTAWVYGARGHNFLLTMLRLMRERQSIRVVNDQLGAPTWSRLIADATALIVAQSMNAGVLALDGRSGTYHLTCGGQTSWCEFAQAIRATAIAQGILTDRCAAIEPIPSTEYPTPAQRPAYSVLSNEKLAQQFSLRLPEWKETLELCLTHSSL